jgi:hypothetical protein
MMGVFALGLKQPGHESDHYMPTNMRFRMNEVTPLLPMYAPIVCTGTNIPADKNV